MEKMENENGAGVSALPPETRSFLGIGGAEVPPANDVAADATALPSIDAGADEEEKREEARRMRRAVAAASARRLVRTDPATLTDVGKRALYRSVTKGIFGVDDAAGVFFDRSGDVDANLAKLRKLVEGDLNAVKTPEQTAWEAIDQADEEARFRAAEKGLKDGAKSRMAWKGEASGGRGPGFWRMLWSGMKTAAAQEQGFPGDGMMGAALADNAETARRTDYESLSDEEKAKWRKATIAEYERQLAKASPVAAFLSATHDMTDGAAALLARSFETGDVDRDELKALSGAEQEKVLTALSLMRGDQSKGKILFVPTDFDDGTKANRFQLMLYGLQQGFIDDFANIGAWGKAAWQQAYAKFISDESERRDYLRRIDLDARVKAALKQPLPDADTFVGAMFQGVAENAHWFIPYGMITKGGRVAKTAKGALALAKEAGKNVAAAEKAVAAAKDVEAAVRFGLGAEGAARQIAAVERYTDLLRTAQSAAAHAADFAKGARGAWLKGRALQSLGRLSAFSSFAQEFIDNADADGLSREDSVPTAAFVGVINAMVERFYVPGMESSLNPAEIKAIMWRSAVEAWRHERMAGLRKWAGNYVRRNVVEDAKVFATEGLVEEELQQLDTEIGKALDRRRKELRDAGRGDLADFAGDLWERMRKAEGSDIADSFGKAWAIYVDTAAEVLPSSVGFGLGTVPIRKAKQHIANRWGRGRANVNGDQGVAYVIDAERRARREIAAWWEAEGEEGRRPDGISTPNDALAAARRAFREAREGGGVELMQQIADAAGVDLKTAEAVHDALQAEAELELVSPRVRMEINLADPVTEVSEKDVKAILPGYVDGSFLADRENGLYSARLKLASGEERALVYRIGDMSQWAADRLTPEGLAEGGEIAASYEARRAAEGAEEMRPWSQLTEEERYDFGLKNINGMTAGGGGVFQFVSDGGRTVTVSADDVISLASGRLADVGYGARATGATLRHETFHALWRFMKEAISPEDKAALYSHFQHLDPKAESDVGLDEAMAQEFERYASGEYVPQQVKGRIEAWTGWAMEKLGGLLDALGFGAGDGPRSVDGSRFTLKGFYDAVLAGRLGSGQLGVELRDSSASSAQGGRDGKDEERTPEGIAVPPTPQVKWNGAQADESAKAEEKAVQPQSPKTQGQSAEADESGATATKVVHTAENPADAATPNQRYYKVGLPNSPVKLVGRLEVRDASTGVITSTDADYHDRGNQNRDDKSEESCALVEKIGANPDPLQVGTVQPIANNGIVWLLNNSNVIIGNHRVNGVRRAYEKGTAGELEKFVREDAAKRGIEIGADVKKPLMVFVLERIESPGGKADVHEVVRLANESLNRGFNIREQAGNDAKILIDNNLLPRMEFRADGRIDETKSGDAIGKFRQESGAQGLIAEDGSLTEEGQTRIQNAALAVLLGGEGSSRQSQGGGGNNALLHKIMSNAGRLDMQSELRALMKMTPELMALAETKPDYDLRAPIAEALQLFTEWRDKDETARVEKGKTRHDWRETTKDGTRKRGLSWEAYLSQGDMFRKPSDEAKILGDLFAKAESLRSFDREDVESTAGKKRVIDLISDYLADYIANARAVNTETEDMFGGSPASRADIMSAQRGKGGEGGGARFSITVNPHLKEDVEAALVTHSKGGENTKPLSRRQDVVMSENLPIFGAIGLPDMKVVCDPAHLRKINDEHLLTPEQIVDLPTRYNDPAVVFRDGDKAFVVVTDMVAPNKAGIEKSVMVRLTEQTKKSGERLFLASAYSRETEKESEYVRLANTPGAAVYCNKNKVAALMLEQGTKSTLQSLADRDDVITPEGLTARIIPQSGAPAQGGRTSASSRLDAALDAAFPGIDARRRAAAHARYSVAARTPFAVTGDDLKRAVSRFGTTDDFDKAIYFMPDGTLLKGKGSVYSFGGRRIESFGHDGFVDLLLEKAPPVDGDGPNALAERGGQIEAAQRGIAAAGAIRISGEKNGLTISREPTPEQYDALWDLADQAYQVMEANGDDTMLVDVTDEKLATLFTLSYRRGTSARRIIEDLRGWYERGERPSQGAARYSIAGRTGAENMGIKGAAEAEAMEKAGADREKIWRETGWWRGRDGKWRVEIPDVKRRRWDGDPEERHFTGGGEDFYRYRLTELIEDGDFLKAYPKARDIVVEFHKNMPANVGGNFNEATLTIKMPQKFHLTTDWAKEGLGDGKSAELNEAGRKTIVHELQHAIQWFEGFAKGGSPTERVRPYALDDKTGHALSVFSEAVGMDPTNDRHLAIIANWAQKIASDQRGDDVPKRLTEKFETAAKEAGKTPQEFRDEIERFYDSKTESPMGQYFKLEGEVEARNVQTRLGMSLEERAATPPWATEDVPADRQIVRYSVTAQTETPQFKNFFGDWEKDPKNASKVVDKDGKPLVVYHGSRTGANIKIFNTPSFFSDNRDVADMFKKEADFILRVNDKEVAIDDITARQIADELTRGDFTPDEMSDWGSFEQLIGDIEDNGKGYGGRDVIADALASVGIHIPLDEITEMSFKRVPDIYECYINIRKPLEIDFKGKTWGQEGTKEMEAAVRDAAKNGYDGVIVRNIREGGLLGELRNGEEPPLSTDYIPVSPTQIKSATDNTGAFDPRNPDIRYSIRSFADGTPFVEVDNVPPDIASEADLDRKRKLVERMLKDRWQGKILDPQGVRAFFNGHSAHEYTNPPNAPDDATMGAKLDAASELEEIVGTSTNPRAVPDGESGHAHDNVKEWEHRDAIFRVDGRFYSARVNIAKLDKVNGKTGDFRKFHDLTAIKDITDEVRYFHGEIQSSPSTSVTTANSIPKPSDEIKRGRASFDFGDAYPQLNRLHDEDLVAVVLGVRLALGKTSEERFGKVTKATAYGLHLKTTERLLRSVRPDLDRMQMAHEVYQTSRRAAKLARALREDLDRGVSESTILRHLPDTMRRTFGEEMKSQSLRGVRLGRFGESAEDRLEARAREIEAAATRNVTGIELSTMEAAWGIDLTATLLAMPPQPTDGEDAGGGAAADATGGEAGTGAAQGAAEEESRKEVDEKVRKAVQRIVENTAVQANLGEMNRKHAREAAGRDAEREAAMASEEGAGEGGASFAEGGGDIVAEAVAKEGVNVNSPLHFALLVKEMVRARWCQEHDLGQDTEPWHNAVAKQFLRRSAANIYARLGRDLCYSAGRETVMRHCASLENVPTVDGIVSEMEFIGRVIARWRIRDSQKRLCENIDTYLQEKFGAKGRFRPGTLLVERVKEATDAAKERGEPERHGVSAEAQLMAKYMRHAMWLSVEGAEREAEEIRRDLAAATVEFRENDSDVEQSRVMADAVRKLNILREWGALQHRTPAEIEAAAEWWRKFYEGESDAIVGEWEKREERTVGIAAAFARGVRNPKQTHSRSRRTGADVANEYIQANYGGFMHLLRDLMRFADDATRGECERYLQWLELEIQKCGTRAATEKRKNVESFRKAVEAIYGKRWEKVVAELTEEDGRFEKFMGEDDDGVKVAPTRGRAMQLLASLVQVGRRIEVPDEENPGETKTVWVGGYHDNIVKHHREEQADELKLLLSPQDLKLIAWMRRWYEQNREGLSGVSQRLFGIGVYAETGNYMPVKMQLDPQGLEKADGVGWTIFPKALTPRVKNERDFDTSADILEMWGARMDEAAQWKTHAALGLELRGIFGRSEFQKAVRASHGAAANRLVLGYITDILSGHGTSDGTGVKTFLDSARGWAAVGALGGNVGVMLKQMTSIPAFGFEIGAVKTATHFVTAFTPAGVSAMLKLIDSDERKNRWTGGNTEAVANAMRVKSPNALKRYLLASMITNKVGDIVPALVIGQGIYRDALERGMSDEDAMAYTWMLVERTQQSSRIENRAAFQRRNSIGNAIYQFLSTQQQYLNYEVRAVRAVLADKTNLRKWGNLANAAVLNHFVLSSLYYWMGQLYRALLGQEPPEDQLKDWVVGMILGPYGALYGMGITTTDAVNNWIKGYQFGKDNAVPSLSWLGSVIVRDPVRLVHDAFDRKKKWSDVVDDLGRWCADFNATFRDLRKIYEFRVKDRDSLHFKLLDDGRKKRKRLRKK